MSGLYPPTRSVGRCPWCENNTIQHDGVTGALKCINCKRRWSLK